MPTVPQGAHGSPRCSSVSQSSLSLCDHAHQTVTLLHWAYLKEEKLLLRPEDQISPSTGWIWSLEHRSGSPGSDQLQCERLTDIPAFLLYLQYFNPACKSCKVFCKRDHALYRLRTPQTQQSLMIGARHPQIQPNSKCGTLGSRHENGKMPKNSD